MTINCKGKIIDLKTPKVMGILNVTPDSFYDAGKYNSLNGLLKRATDMLSAGATFFDLGGYSSKPHAEYVSFDEELQRLLPALDALSHEFPDVPISIDTFRSGIASACVDHGAAMINDISAGSLDTDMLETVARLRVPYIMMHMRGNPQTMQQLTQYDDIVKEMLFYFAEKVAAARSLGINDIIIDPGFGFAKTLEQNYEVMQKLQLFEMLDLPLLVGVSRKSMIYKALGINSEQALNGTTALHMVALSRGAKILRVHDVKEAVACVKLFELVK
ncbi:MAG TPA: dihydropteroate synthase [Flavobacterium sp.]|jgi:dihydropteroate synthase